jgi:hypothetical protein
MDLKAELGLPRKKQLETKDLRSILANLVNDEANDGLALKVFSLIFYNNFVCPGYSVKVLREAPIVKDFDVTKLKDVDLCQLMCDELRIAVFAWQAANSDWRAVPGCGIAILLMYLDYIDHPKLSPIDKRVPRILYFNAVNFRKLADLDYIKPGNETPSWIYGKLSVSVVFLLCFTCFY